MQFNNPEFLLLFFPIVTLIWFAVPRVQWSILLSASILFYSFATPHYIPLMVISILGNWIIGRYVEKETILRTYFFWIGISLNLLLLGIFKYYNFFISQSGIPIPLLTLALPLGISFYTFQAISYLVEVYKHRQKSESHVGIFALYLLFYPQIIAGPINRPQQLLPQLHAKHLFDYDRVAAGLKRILWGLFKKAVVADRLGFFVDHIYNNPEGVSGISTLIATYLFTFQLYTDFSGYTDIALGIAQVMGITLKENFNLPLQAFSVTDFWNRWHISLSSWFRDYVYLPLALVWRFPWHITLLCVFFLSGLWHGAGWNFIIFGVIHGTLIVTERLITQRWRKSIRLPFTQWISIIYTFHAVSFSLIFFRVDVKTALTILQNIAHIPQELMSRIPISKITLDQPPIAFLFIIILIACVHISENLYQKGIRIESKPLYVRWLLYYALVFTIIFFGKFFQKRLFIYFQF